MGKDGAEIKVNLQQLPKTKAGFDVRRAFIAASGYYLFRVDYSQIEYRVMASLAGEVSLVNSFRSGVDFHKQTAATMLGKDLDEPNKFPKKLHRLLGPWISDLCFS